MRVFNTIYGEACILISLRDSITMQITAKFACGRRNENKDNLSIKQRQIEREIQKNRKQTQYSTWSHIGMTDKSDRGKREEGKK